MTAENIKILFDAGFAIAESCLKSGNRSDALEIAVEAACFAEEIVAGIEADSYFSEIACGPGCPYCCSMQIRITPPEALLLGDYILKTFSHARMLELAKRIALNIALTDEKSFEEKVDVWHQTQCIFLESGSCSLYQVRPFICRSWHSLDKGRCLKAYKMKQPGAEIESYPHRNIVFGTIRKGIIQGCMEKGLQSGVMVITKAVKAFIEYKGDPVSDWIEGKAVFPEQALIIS